MTKLLLETAIKINTVQTNGLKLTGSCSLVSNPAIVYNFSGYFSEDKVELFKPNETLYVIGSLSKDTLYLQNVLAGIAGEDIFIALGKVCSNSVEEKTITFKTGKQGSVYNVNLKFGSKDAMLFMNCSTFNDMIGQRVLKLNDNDYVQLVGTFSYREYKGKYSLNGLITDLTYIYNNSTESTPSTGNNGNGKSAYKKQVVPEPDY